MEPLSPISLTSSDKLAALRRIDLYRPWQSVADHRQCLQCGEIVTGRQIEIVGGTRGLGPLRIQCPTPGCPATVLDLALPQTARSARADAVRTGDEPKAAPAEGEKAWRRRRAFERLVRALHLSRPQRVN